MAADYAALETRVSELEQQVRHMLPGKIDAVSYGVSLVHEDTQAIRTELGTVRTELGAELGTVRAELGTVRTEQARHGELLEQILRRLPNGST